MDPSKYAILAPYLSLILLFFALMVYGQKDTWPRHYIIFLLKFVMAIGFLGVVYSFYMLIKTADFTYSHVSFAWLLLEFGGLQFLHWLKKERA